MILARLVKVSWHAWPIFGPTSRRHCGPIVGQTFLLFLARLCQLWPRPAEACPGHADHLCFFAFPSQFGPGKLRPGHAGLALWPRLPRFFLSPGQHYQSVATSRAHPGFQAGLWPRSTPVWPGSLCKGKSKEPIINKLKQPRWTRDRIHSPNHRICSVIAPD